MKYKFQPLQPAAPPTQRELVEWEQEDAIFMMLTKTERWMTIAEMVAYGPVARSLADQMGDPKCMGTAAITRRVTHMHWHRILEARAATTKDGRVLSKTLEYRVREANP